MPNKSETGTGCYNQRREYKDVYSPIVSFVEALQLEKMTVIDITDDSTRVPNEPQPHIYKNPVNFSPEIPEEHMTPIRLAQESGFCGS